MGKVSNTKGSFQKKLAEMKKKIKQTNQDANACDIGKHCSFYKGAETSQYVVIYSILPTAFFATAVTVK